jgi:hypothetical protein
VISVSGKRVTVVGGDPHVSLCDELGRHFAAGIALHADRLPRLDEIKRAENSPALSIAKRTLSGRHTRRSQPHPPIPLSRVFQLSRPFAASQYFRSNQDDRWESITAAQETAQYAIQCDAAKIEHADADDLYGLPLLLIRRAADVAKDAHRAKDGATVEARCTRASDLSRAGRRAI